MKPVRVHLPDGRTHVGPVVDLRDEADAPDADALRRATLFGSPVPADAPRVVAPDRRPSRRSSRISRPGRRRPPRCAGDACARRGHVAAAERTLERANAR
ncbi:hypothetical protein [Halogeometricum sp. CBA1124]|uniref:hypothetical protein n=1 Tax=Halogeometricum sp. CBA1124 TaxID=2668071 RepID=UPI001429436D|nr:hypothetical protein [Halogeometricum sp. CBA1124]MUV57895.1 hypothetical protein [Halogeometricum sp. CBA1124]